MSVKRVPEVVFKTRVRDESIEGENPFRWQDVSSEENLAANRRVVVFALAWGIYPYLQQHPPAWI